MNDIYFASVIKRHFSESNCICFAVAYSYAHLILEDREVLQKLILKVEALPFNVPSGFQVDSYKEQKAKVLHFLKEIEHFRNLDVLE